MDKFLKKQLYVWVYDKIKSNPKKFGGDFSNSLIMYEYLKEFYQGHTVEELEHQLMSILSTVSRIKNKLLEKNPHFDFRTKYRPKKRKNNHKVKPTKTEDNK
ncbi:hypothetical protein [Arcobacter arenosus]|uniref:hypothetical protein n=1 Tax=Arcobacter arenosus TaxID=2576037 RepID=UPI003BAC0B5B